MFLLCEQEQATQQCCCQQICVSTGIGNTPQPLSNFYHDHCGKQLSNYYYLTQDYLYYHSPQPNTIHSFPLMLSSMEDRYWLTQGTKTYGILLYNSNLNLKTTLYTYNLDDFQQLFVKLSKYLVMRNFHENYKLSQQLISARLTQIYLANHIITHEEVIVKVYYKQQLSTSTYALLQNQIQNLYRLKQLSLSPLIEAYETFQCILLVFKKANHGTLIDYLKNNCHHYSIQLIKNIARQLLMALQVIHSLGIIHHDIKPDNIVFEGHQLFLIDYGISLTQQTFLNKQYIYFNSGTQGFVAPQVSSYRHHHSEPYTTQSDVYSVGCLLYFLLTGHTFDPHSKQSQIYDIIDNLPINQSTKHLIQAMLTSNPKHRITLQDALQSDFFKQTTAEPYIFREDLNSQKKYVLEKKISNYWGKIL